jgi:hypothetical protein
VGKGLLVKLLALTATGREPTLIPYPAGEDELRKKITTLAMYAPPIAVFDNVNGILGNGTLDEAITAEMWGDRLLGGNRQVTVPLRIMWIATCNNLTLAADTARRTLHVRLVSALEHPEERTSFRHPNPTEWVIANRARLVSAALSILQGYIRAGRPDKRLTPWGSFEGWSDLVRSALVWANLPDPGDSRTVR